MSIAEKRELSDLERLDEASCLIKLDYAYHPRRRPWDPSRSKVFDIINAGVDRYTGLLEKFAAFDSFFERIPLHDRSPDSLSPRWLNGWFPSMDAISVYGLLAINNPHLYMEVGSGYSTMFARQAIKDHGLQTSIISIDPSPRANIDSICDEVIRQSCEEVPASIFNSLAADDILFVDNSHRAFPNSDVTVFFTEILPYLPTGIVYGIHDIFLPWDYPDEWKERYYNEQYLLAAYLLGGADGDEITLPNAFLSSFAPHLLVPLDGTLNNTKLAGIGKTGSAIWLRRA